MESFQDLALYAVELHKKKNFLKAKKLYEKLLTIDSKNSQILRLLALIEHEFKNYSKSLELLDKSIFFNKNNSEAYANRGIVYFKINNNEKAKENYFHSIKIDNNINALFNLGNLFKSENDFLNAEKYFNKVIDIKPNFYKAYHNRAVLKILQNKNSEALDDFNLAIKIKPDYANSIFYKSLIQLKKGNFDDGWKNYEWRWLTTDFENLFSKKRNFKEEYWNGNKDIKGKTILLHGEQGLGDQIQFIRFYKLVKNLGTKVIIEVDKRLVTLFRETLNIKDIFAQGSNLPNFDLHCPLMSLPLKFSINLKNIPAEKNYLICKPTRIQNWKNSFDFNKINIGINWQGGNHPTFDKGRSFVLENFKNISSIKNVKLYSLQKITGLDQIDNIKQSFNLNTFKNLDEEASFIDTSAIIMNLDLVITPDTSIAHLAGALGKKTFLLLHKNSEWRWLDGRSDTPWYPNTKIYKQEVKDDWEHIFNKVKLDILKITNL